MTSALNPFDVIARINRDPRPRPAASRRPPRHRRARPRALGALCNADRPDRQDGRARGVRRRRHQRRRPGGVPDERDADNTILEAPANFALLEHVVGIKGARRVIAINKDRDAPIFQLADLGVVADALDVLPAVIAELAAVRATP
jgi:hypothetical protein